MNLKPSEIIYSQDSINNKFGKHSRHKNIYIGDTLDALCEGRCSVSDIPPIRVAKEDGKWITADNRRLWVFREMERLGKCDTIRVEKVDSISGKKKTTSNGGISVILRRSAGGLWHDKPDAPKLTLPSSSTESNNTSSGNNDQNSSQIKSMTTISYNASTIELDNSQISEDNDRPSSTTSTYDLANLTTTRQSSYASNDTFNSTPNNSQLGDSFDNTGLQSGDNDCPAKNTSPTEKSAKKKKVYKAREYLKRSLTRREEDSLVLWLRNRSFLYDTEFKYMKMKQNIWTEKEKELNLNPGDLSTIWYPNMRSQYLKIIRRNRYGSDTCQRSARHLWLRRSFNFLRPFLVGPRCRTQRRSNFQRQKTPTK